MHSTREDAVADRAHRTSRRALGALFRGVAVMGMLVLGGAACETKNLHPSHGLRHREMMAAQNNARGTHDPAARGDEAVLPVQAYLQKLSGDSQGAGASGGGGGGGMMNPSNSTAGVKPLVH